MDDTQFMTKEFLWEVIVTIHSLIIIETQCLLLWLHDSSIYWTDTSLSNGPHVGSKLGSLMLYNGELVFWILGEVIDKWIVTGSVLIFENFSSLTRVN